MANDLRDCVIFVVGMIDLYDLCSEGIGGVKNSVEEMKVKLEGNQSRVVRE